MMKTAQIRFCSDDKAADDKATAQWKLLMEGAIGFEDSYETLEDGSVACRFTGPADIVDQLLVIAVNAGGDVTLLMGPDGEA